MQGWEIRDIYYYTSSLRKRQKRPGPENWVSKLESAFDHKLPILLPSNHRRLGSRVVMVVVVVIVVVVTVVVVVVVVEVVVNIFVVVMVG